jgi:phosphonate transport system substrate-binding protein
MNTKAFSLLAIVLVMALAGGCQIGASAAPIGATAVASEPLATLSPSQIITIGDIDSDEPAKKIKRFQPLADYLATHLAEFGIKEGRVVIAWDIPQMGIYLKQEKVDLYLDSSFPTLSVQKLSDSEVILRRWKQGEPTYWSVYIARRDSGITSG